MDLSARVYGPSSIRSPSFKSLLIGCAPMEPNLALFIYPPNVVISRFSNRNVLETALELGPTSFTPSPDFASSVTTDNGISIIDRNVHQLPINKDPITSSPTINLVHGVDAPTGTISSHRQVYSTTGHLIPVLVWVIPLPNLLLCVDSPNVLFLADTNNSQSPRPLLPPI